MSTPTETNKDTPPMQAFKRIYFLVHGNVQGVFFRKHTLTSATTHNLTGFVRNTPQGKVEGEAQGLAENIEKFLKDVDRGPVRSRVVLVEKTEREEVKDGEEGFKIIR